MAYGCAFAAQGTWRSRRMQSLRGGCLERGQRRCWGLLRELSVPAGAGKCEVEHNTFLRSMPSSTPLSSKRLSWSNISLNTTRVARFAANATTSAPAAAYLMTIHWTPHKVQRVRTSNSLTWGIGCILVCSTRCARCAMCRALI